MSRGGPQLRAGPPAFNPRDRLVLLDVYGTNHDPRKPCPKMAATPRVATVRRRNLSINPARIPALPASGFVLTDVRRTMPRDVT